MPSANRNVEEIIRRGGRILILCPYPEGIAAGQRFRVEQYLEHLHANGYRVTVEPFLDAKAMAVLYEPGYFLLKTRGVIRGYLRRFLTLFSIRSYDYIFLYREAAPLGPPFLEAAMLLMHRRVVYDFDDAIFMPNTSSANRLTRMFKLPSKTRFIVKRCWKVAVSTPSLEDWAKRLNKSTWRIPTVVDLSYHRLATRSQLNARRPVVGWTGTHSTAKYLDLVRPALVQLEALHDFEFVVICDIDPKFDELRNYRFVRWNLRREIEDLSGIDIGLMPLSEGEWEVGKAGFKAIQYSAVGAVPVVSAVGVANSVVINGETGFVVSNTKEEWVRAIGALLASPQLVSDMGKQARAHIEANYSVTSQLHKFLSLFSEVERLRTSHQ